MIKMTLHRLLAFFLLTTFNLAWSTPIENVESDFDLTSRTINRANQIVKSINRDVNLCLTNSEACSRVLSSSSSLSSSLTDDDSDEIPVSDSVSVSVYGKLDPTTVSPQSSLLYAPPSLDGIVASSRDEKFSVVLRDLDQLEDQVQSAIANFTTSRRFTYIAMLKPMLTHIDQLRNNLTLLRTRIIGVAAMTTIAAQVNELTDSISDALVGNNSELDDDLGLEGPKVTSTIPPKYLPDQEEELKALANSLGR